LPHPVQFHYSVSLISILQYDGMTVNDITHTTFNSGN